MVDTQLVDTKASDLGGGFDVFVVFGTNTLLSLVADLTRLKLVLQVFQISRNNISLQLFLSALLSQCCVEWRSVFSGFKVILTPL